MKIFTRASIYFILSYTIVNKAKQTKKLRKCDVKMKGTTLLLNEDQTVTVLENVEMAVYEDLKKEEEMDQPHCKINDKEVTFEPVQTVAWYEDGIDLAYGY